MAKFQKNGGSSEVMILGNNSSRVMIMRNTFRKIPENRKIGKVEILVIVAGGDLAEIRTLLKMPRNGEIPKWGSSEVMILGILSRKR